MSENFNYKKQFLLEDKDGTRWLIFLSSENRILYSHLKNRENKSQNNVVDSQPVRDFHATVDENGIIRILSYTLSKQLIYYEWINNRWERQVLERIYSRFQNIPYICILTSSSSIHILYYIESSLMKSAESLVHYYLQEGKWYGGRLWKFISDESASPRAAFIDVKDDLHIVFTKHRKNDRPDFFHACFHSDSCSWTGPYFIHTSIGHCDQFQLYVDMHENIHLVWRESMDNTYRLKHLYNVKEAPMQSWNEAILYQSNNEISFPTIVHGKELICLWKENNVLYQIKFLDSARSWSHPYSLAEHNGKQLGLFHFISYNRSEFPSHSINLWGQEYPDIRLAGIDETHLSEQKLPEADYSNKWTEAMEAISLTNKETKKIKTQLTNLSTKVDQLYSTVYELEEQLKIKEKSIFAIQTEIKRLGFEIRKIYQRPKQMPGIESVKKTPAPTANKIEATKPANPDTQDHADIPRPEQSNNKSTETERITLGNTTILINPENSEH